MAIKTKQQLLAWDLVEGLSDETHKGIYFRLTKIYNESFLREILSNVKNAYNQGRIKKEDCGRYFMGILSAKSGSAFGGKKESSKVNFYVKNNVKNIKNNTRKRPDFKKKSRAGKKS